MKNKKNTSKLTPVFKPFSESDERYMIPFDEEYMCIQDSCKEDVEEMSLEELEVLEDSLVDDIADYDTIIDLQLNTICGFDKDSLRMDRKRRQKCVVELREIKKRIKILKNNRKEVAIAV